MGYPVVTSTPADEITQVRAHLYGACADSGNGNLTRIGFVRGTSSRSDAQVGNNAPGDTGYTWYGWSTGSWGVPKSWDSAWSSWSPNTPYYWRACAETATGWAYSAERTFTTLAIVPPTVLTHAATSIRGSIAVGNGEVTERFGGTIDHRGIVYGETSRGDPGDTIYSGTNYDSYEDEAGTFGETAFNRLLTSLSSSTQYFFRAYAHNEAGYAYGDELDFTTLAGSPAQLLRLNIFKLNLIRAGG